MFLILSFSFEISAQIIPAKPQDSVVVKAGAHYKKGKLYQWLWGRHYRREWVTPVKVKAAYLDTLFGGLTPVKRGGGRQTKNLRLEDSLHKQYVLRSIDKTFTGALPENMRGTFIENIINDQVSIAHPYAAITIPPMINAAGVYHTEPQILFIPRQPRLDSFNDAFGDQLFLIEERPDEDQSQAPNFGYAENVIGTRKLFEKLEKKNTRIVDGKAYVKARLFDMFIGDWGRHEDQWRWSEFEYENKTIYQPVPRDRDQAYTLFDGSLLSLLMSAASLKHLQSFSHEIKDVAHYNFPARHLDRKVANSVTRAEFSSIAVELQRQLTDSVITQGIQQLPPEVYPISGPELIRKLKGRRDQLTAIADQYYLSLARVVEITGSKQHELFELMPLNKQELRVRVFTQTSGDYTHHPPIYERVFRASETKEINIYGLDGQDQFLFKGSSHNPIKVRVIGGPSVDHYIEQSKPGYKHNISIYDNQDNDFQTRTIQKKLSSNPFVHFYDYHAFAYDKSGFSPVVGYNTEDLVFAGLKFQVEKQRWRKYPFGQQHTIELKYAFVPRSINIGYTAFYNKVLGYWNVHAKANYAPVHVRNYFGVGNNTARLNKPKDYYRMRSSQVSGRIGVNRQLMRHFVSFSLQHQSTRLWRDSQRFIEADLHRSQTNFDWDHFAGVQGTYTYNSSADESTTKQAFRLAMQVNHLYWLQRSKTFTRYAVTTGFHLPLSGAFAFYNQTGLATVSGQPPFYQLNTLGGADDLRGYRRHRFYGKTSFYSNNELQWTINIQGHLYKGPFVLMGLFDQGRVWQPGEASSKWHVGYGGGIRLMPFSKLSITATCAFSNEDRIFNLRIGMPLAFSTPY